MVTLNPTQKMHIANIRTARAALWDAKAYSEARAKDIVTKELASHQALVDNQVRLAFGAGIPKAQIGRNGLGTSDSKTVDDILKRTEGAAALADKLETDPLAHRYSFDESTELLTITLSGQELAEAVAYVGHKGAALTSAQFHVITRDDGSMYLKNVTPAHNSTYDPHPIVTWGRVVANEAEALAWYVDREPGK